jgi:23S rRNA (pseudouridine1915-N3)-methyltransferase
MKFRILFADRPKHDPLEAYEADFIKRISRMGTLTLEEINCSKFAKLEAKARKKKETDALLERVERSEYSVALDEGGKEHSSESFAEWLQGLGVQGKSRVVFLIGGAHGHDDSIKGRVNAIISLSRLTFTSQLARALLVEQLYRALSIINGTPYHKE